MADDFTIPEPSLEMQEPSFTVQRPGEALGDAGTDKSVPPSLGTPDTMASSENQTIQDALSWTEPGHEMDLNRLAPGYGQLIDPIYYDHQNIEQNIRDTLIARENAIAPLEKQYSSTMKALSDLPVPKLTEVPTPEYFERMHSQAGQFASHLGLMVAMSPLLSRQNASASMLMFGKALKGYMKGNKRLADEAFREYRINLQAATQKNDHMIQQYKLIMDTYKTNLNALRVAIQQKALEFKDPLTHQWAQTARDTNDITVLHNHLNGLTENNQRVKLEGMQSIAYLSELPLRIKQVQDEVKNQQDEQTKAIGAQRLYTQQHIEDLNKRLADIQKTEKELKGTKGIVEAKDYPTYLHLKREKESLFQKIAEEQDKLGESPTALTNPIQPGGEKGDKAGVPLDSRGDPMQEGKQYRDKEGNTYVWENGKAKRIG